MLGFGTKKSVSETEATGEVARVFHEIRQVLRVSGVNLNFRTWATFEKALPVMWDAMRPNLETRAFEDAADEVRRKAVQAAAALGKLDSLAGVRLGESQCYQLQAALDLYHYINPKLLVFTCAVRLALNGERVSAAAPGAAEKIQLGEPPAMFPMEMVAEEPDDEQLAALFEDIKTTLGLASINSDYRTLGLWPQYLASAWAHLRPVVTGQPYQQAADALRKRAREVARSLPLPIELSRERIEETGEDVDAFVEKTEKFEQLLPPLILNIALLELEWEAAETLCESPFPATSRGGAGR